MFRLKRQHGLWDPSVLTPCFGCHRPIHCYLLWIFAISYLCTVAFVLWYGVNDLIDLKCTLNFDQHELWSGSVKLEGKDTTTHGMHSERSNARQNWEHEASFDLWCCLPKASLQPPCVHISGIISPTYHALHLLYTHVKNASVQVAAEWCSWCSSSLTACV